MNDLRSVYPLAELVRYHEMNKETLSTLTGKECKEHPLDPLFAKKNQTMMQEVWEKLTDLASTKQDDQGVFRFEQYMTADRQEAFDQVCRDFYADCDRSLEIYAKTIAERRKEFENIARRARDLARMLEDSDLAFHSVLYFIEDKAAANTLQDIVRSRRIERLPGLPELLIGLANKAKVAASQPHEHQTSMRLSKRADGRIPLSTFRRAFVINLSKRMIDRYGKPFDGLVATTTTVLFGIDTSADYVKINRSRKR